MFRCSAPRPRGRWALLLAGVLASGFAPRPLWAQEDSKELVRARAKFQRATELEQAGNWAGALQLFREVGQVKMTPQVRYHIALCEMNLGKLVAALGGYELALAEADEVGPGFRQEVTQSIDELKERIPRLVIERGEGAQAASIELDGVALGSNYIGVKFPIDPGPHTVEATAPGYQRFSTTVNVEERKVQTVEVVLERLANAAGTAGSVPGAATDPGAAGPSDPPSPVPMLVAGGVGAAGLVASGVFLVLRQGAIGAAEDLCGDPDRPDPGCERGTPRRQEADSELDSASTYDALMWGSAAVGVVGIGIAATLYFTQSRPDTSSSARRAAGLRLEPSAPHTDAGLSLVGRF